jgi:hypothetical protein
VPLTFGSRFVVLLSQTDKQHYELDCDDRTCLGEEESEFLLALIGFRRRRGYLPWEFNQEAGDASEKPVGTSTADVLGVGSRRFPQLAGLKIKTP